jgi:hypothetical protein
MSETATGYGAAFDLYHRLGWPAVLPLPRGKKKTPPEGYTGRDGIDPSYADMQTWADNGYADGNLALRAPATMVGIDVDDYDGKNGAATIAHAETRWRATLPLGYRSSARPNDPVSGIRWFRIPPGVKLRDRIEFGDKGLGGVEIIQRHHRYGVVWPSIHPDTGNTYLWYGIDGSVTDTPPAVDDLPYLPDEWIDALQVSETESDGADLGPDGNVDVQSCLTEGDMSQRVAFKLGRALSEVLGTTRHDHIRDRVLGLLRCGKNDEPGVKRALNVLYDAFVNRVAKDRTGGRDEAKAEFKDFVYGDKVPELLADPDYDDEPTAGENDSSTTESDAWKNRVKARVRDLRLEAEARRQLAAEQRKTTTPPVTLTAFLAKPDDEPQYRIDRLLPTGGRVLLTAQYKAGKTAMRDNLIHSLADETSFLGEFGVRGATVTLIDVEVDERQLRRWLRCQTITSTDSVRVKPLRGEVSTFDILDRDVRAEWARWLAGSEVVVLDCLRPVLDALGLSEDKDTGQFLVAFDELLKESGASEAVVTHHMGHTGERSRGDSRLLDWPDVNWRIIKDKDADDPDNPDVDRYFSAYGRDVDVPEGLLDYTPETRSLMYIRRSRAGEKVRAVIPHLIELVIKEPGLSKTAIEARLQLLAARKVIREAISAAITEGKLYTTEEGKSHAVRHYVSPSQAA